MPHITFQWFYPFFEGIALGIVAMLLHEVGHLLAALALGIKVRSVGFRWKGLYTVRESGPPAKNLLISLAGPFTNVVLMFTWHWSSAFCLANFCFALGNLVPIEGSDGERAWNCWRKMQQQDPQIE